MDEKLLEVRNLKKYFKTPHGILHAVDDVSFTLGQSKTLGVVGESGCGKSTLGRTVLNLLEATSGEVYFQGKNIVGYKGREQKELRKDMQIVFQDPFSSLDPRMTVSEIIGEPLRLFKICKSEQEYEERVDQLMDTAGIAKRLENSYPHDLSVVRHISDEIRVMYLGQAVEKSPAKKLFVNQYHPYTKALLSAIPIAKTGERKKRILLKGEISSPIDPKPGCRFAVRCPYATDICRNESPVLREIEPEHFVACHHVGNLQ